MKPEDINQIKKLFFYRVRDTEKRANIIQLASLIASLDEGLKGKPSKSPMSMEMAEEQEKDFWSAIYHYSLSENWPEIDREIRFWSGLDTTEIDNA